MTYLVVNKMIKNTSLIGLGKIVHLRINQIVTDISENTIYLEFNKHNSDKNHTDTIRIIEIDKNNIKTNKYNDPITEITINDDTFIKITFNQLYSWIDTIISFITINNQIELKRKLEKIQLFLNEYIDYI